MTIFIIALSVIATLFGVLSVVFGIGTIRKQSGYTLPQQLRKYIRTNKEIYGVCNHGKSMDEIKDIRVLSSKQLGLEEI